MKKILLIALILIPGLGLKAQTPEDSVKAVINTLFKGMKSADTELLHDVFADSAIMQTISRNKEGKTVIITDDHKKFIDFIKTLKPGAADERISFETIKIDGPLAIAWTPYKFYFNEKFSHCGVNSFQLVRMDGKWKIQYLIDTRRRSGCE